MQTALALSIPLVLLVFFFFLFIYLCKETASPIAFLAEDILYQGHNIFRAK